MNGPKSYILPEELRMDLLRYLYGQPYGAVTEGVQRLEALQELVIDDTPKAAPLSVVETPREG